MARGWNLAPVALHVAMKAGGIAVHVACCLCLRWGTGWQAGDNQAVKHLTQVGQTSGQHASTLLACLFELC